MTRQSRQRRKRRHLENDERHLPDMPLVGLLRSGMSLEAAGSSRSTEDCILRKETLCEGSTI